MATNSIFTISGKQCSLVKRSASTGTSDATLAAASTTSSGAVVTALPDLVSSGSAIISSSGTGVTVIPVAGTTSKGTSKATTTLDSASSSTDPVATSTGHHNGNGSGQQSKDSGNTFSVGLIVGIILALLIAIGVAAAVWLFMRRRKRKQESQEPKDEKDEHGAKSSLNDDSEYYVVVLYSSLRRRIRYLRGLVLARLGRPTADDDQPADSPFSDAAAVPAARSPPPTLPQMAQTSTFVSGGLPNGLPNGRPRSESFDDRDWFNTIAGPREKLVVTNPNPPTPGTATLVNPFADPDESRLPQATSKATSTPPTPLRRSAELQPQSGSYSGLNFNLPPSTSSQPFVAVPPKRRSTSPSNPYANRGPSFYPPTTGPLPTFEDIQDANHFADPIPPLPTAARPTSRPGIHQRQDTANSSIVMLPSPSATNSYDFTSGASRSSSQSRISENSAFTSSAGGRRSISLGSARASSILLNAPNLDNMRSGINFSRPSSFASFGPVDAPSPLRPSTRSITNSPHSRDVSPGANTIARTALNNTMAWKFPSKTMSGGAYLGGDRGSQVTRGSGTSSLGLVQHGSRDTTYTARSDPFDLEGRLG